MKYLYLPGYSPKNEREQLENSRALAAAEVDVVKHKYRHWINDSYVFDIDQELASALALIPEHEEFGIIAKSIGTFLAMKVIATRAKKIRSLLLMGVPVNDLDEDELAEYRLMLPKVSHITVLQNENDTHGSAAQVEELLKDIKHQLVVKSAEDHDYIYPQDIVAIIK